MSRTEADSIQNIHDSSVDFLESVFELKKPSNETAPVTNLFSQDMDGDAIGDSQLEALCSGTFATQAPNVVRVRAMCEGLAIVTFCFITGH